MTKLDRSLIEEIGFNPYYQMMDGKQYVDLASNNYLGLAGDDRVKSAAIQAIREYGVSMCGTPIATGYTALFQRVEQRLSEFTGLEEAILFPSCYQANNGLFANLVKKEDIILFDRLAHSSLIQGIRAVGCKIQPFLHNDMNHLQTILDRTRGRKIFVVTESVFSTEGSIAPLDEIIKLCDQYGAMPMVDDSHGIGVLGSQGGGILKHFQIRDFKGIYTASLGKALVGSGGMIAGRGEVIEYLRYYCPHLIYSTAVTPATLGGIDGVLDVLADEFRERSARMWKYKSLIENAVDGLIPGEAPVNAILTGEAKKTIRLAKLLFERNILSTPFIEPSVPANQGVVRLIAGAGLTGDQVQAAIDAIKESLCVIS